MTPLQAKPGSYHEISRVWRAGDVVELRLDFVPTLWEANPLVEETLNPVALRCGPLVYCAESNDLPAGVRLTEVALAAEAKPADFSRNRLGIAGTTVVAITAQATAAAPRPWAGKELYREVAPESRRPLALTFVPYFAWGNRGDTEMSVWLPRR